jgi:metal-sulfur cluster biosynthetic enzyme
MTEQNLSHTWEADKSNPETCKKLREALQAVRDPEIGTDIIQLGLIRDVRIREDEAIIVMILTTPYCPFGPAMLEAARRKAEEILGIPTKVELGKEIWDQSMIESGSGLDWGLY